MRVMVIVKATNESEDGQMPTPELLEQMGAFNQQLTDAGILVDAAGLSPSAKGARVVSARRWVKGTQLAFASRSGEFRSEARVAYCQPLHGQGYAIGVEFLEPQGRWVVESAN